MRTSKMIYNEYSNSRFEGNLEMSLDDIQQILHDAMKEGMRIASEVAQKISDEKTWGISNPDTRYAEAILTAAEQLTIKDL